MPALAPGAELNYADSYYRAGYEIVQIKWDSPWEQTDVPSQTNSPYLPSTQFAACRPATFLKYVYDHYFTRGTPVGNGLCIQGASAGSAAAAYSLAYYGLRDYVDYVNLLAGPPLGDMEVGCQVPKAPALTVCGQNNGNQIGCKLGPGGSTWDMSPQYIAPAVNGVGSWTNDLTCGNNQLTGTFPSSMLAWHKMSIVDDGTNNPTFSYPNTAIAGWLCRTLQNPGTANYCANHSDQMHCPNNTSPQGQIFYAAITANGVTPPKPYAIYAVDRCLGDEGVSDDSPPPLGSNVPGYNNGQFTGFGAIKDAMLNGCVNNH